MMTLRRMISGRVPKIVMIFMGSLPFDYGLPLGTGQAAQDALRRRLLRRLPALARAALLAAAGPTARGACRALLTARARSRRAAPGLGAAQPAAP
ncbi:hypothetical protein ACFTAO_38125 [Paenibacillus rhizoplanae]